MSDIPNIWPMHLLLTRCVQMHQFWWNCCFCILIHIQMDGSTFLAFLCLPLQSGVWLMHENRIQMHGQWIFIEWRVPVHQIADPSKNQFLRLCAICLPGNLHQLVILWLVQSDHLTLDYCFDVHTCQFIFAFQFPARERKASRLSLFKLASPRCICISTGVGVWLFSMFLWKRGLRKPR